ncbi:hypothetical protein HY251_12975 [bacterium]|nr:hypothetical protein [bacterium]
MVGSFRANGRGPLLRRFLVMGAFALAVSGCETPNYYNGTPFQTSHKIEVRRRSPTKEELAARPPKPYEQELREQDAYEERMAVSREMHDETRYMERSDRELRRWSSTSRPDPWEAYERERKRVLYRPWADTGPPAAVEVEPKVQKPIEDDPYAPVPKAAKKAEGEEGGEATAPADKPGDKPEDKPAEKPAEGPKKK